MKNNSSPISIWQGFLFILKNSLKKAQKFISKISPTTLQFIQLTFMYFFAVVDLIHTILNAVFSLGYVPEIIMPFFILFFYTT